MSMLGDLLGYDGFGNDLIGVNRDESQNCPACGVSASAHTPQMVAECTTKLFHKTRPPEESA